MALAQPIQRLTEAEYLAQERAAEFKSEYLDGEVFAMSGGSLRHSLIATNLASEFRTRLKGRPWVAFNSDLRVKVEETGLITYPDLSVICGQAQFVDPEADTVTNPTLLAEVLSPSTESYDRGAKFRYYVQIPTLREVLLVSHHEARIEQFVRQADGPWLWRAAQGVEVSMEISSLGITLALGEVFANVEFAPVPLRPSPGRKD
jgi:Uma2 family endonuclease